MARAKKTEQAMQVDELEGMLTRLKLTAIQDERRIQIGLSIAKFLCVRTLEGFEFEAQPSIDPRLVRELATSRWVANGDTVLLLGPPGVGETHLAVALCREAIPRGYSTLFASATSIVTQLVPAHAEGRLEETLTHLAKPKLLVIGELGYLPFEANAAHLFFQLVSRRYERGATLLTSNLSVAEWGGACSATRWWLPPSWTGCCITAML